MIGVFMLLDMAGLREVDVNKLIIFMTVYREASVSNAACILGVTQPAISNALSDMRICFCDQLFVRRDGGMQPTTKADSIAESLLPILTSLSALVGQFTPGKYRH
jgi:DNA-binding transcriptional LysR family regulator